MNAPEWFLLLYKSAVISSLILAIPSLILYRRRVTSFFGGLVFLMVAALWFSRYSLTGHLPMFGALESTLSLSFFSGMVLLPCSQIYRIPYLSLYPLLVGILLFHGNHYSSAMYALTISERGFWVHLHAIAAFVTFALGTWLLGSSIFVLLKHQAKIGQILLFFYLAYALTIITGSFYEFLLFGRVWSFDPIETMNLACFLSFTTIVHLASFQNWPQEQIARWSMFCCVLMILAFRLILLFPPSSTYHIFDIDLRIHITLG